MVNFLLLLKIRLIEMLEISATFNQKELSKKIYLVMQRIFSIGLFAVVFLIMRHFARYMVGQQLGEALPVVGYFAAVIITFLVTVFGLYENFSGNDDSEFLLSMPFSAATQVFVMFTIMYVKNLIICTVIELPFYLEYCNSVSMNFFWGAWLWGLLLTSLPVCGISVLIGMVIILSLVHNPRKNQIISGIIIFFVMLSVVFALVMVDRLYLVSTGQIQYDGKTLATGFVDEICKNFKFGRFYQKGIVEGNGPYILLFSFMSIIWYAVFLFMHTMAYRSAITALRSPLTYGVLTRENAEKQLVERTRSKAVLRKEFNQFFRSERYILQAALGVILGVAIPIDIAIMGSKIFEQQKIIVLLLICVCVGISNTTYCAMSMEGKRYWITNTSPTKNKELTRAKLILNLVVVSPIALLGGTICAIIFEGSIFTRTSFIIIPAVYSVVNGVFGGFIGEKKANFSYSSEDMIMHRGVPFLLGYFPGILIPMILLFAKVMI